MSLLAACCVPGRPCAPAAGWSPTSLVPGVCGGSCCARAMWSYAKEEEEEEEEEEEKEEKEEEKEERIHFRGEWRGGRAANSNPPTENATRNAGTQKYRGLSYSQTRDCSPYVRTGTMQNFMQSSYFQLSQMPSVQARMVTTCCCCCCCPCALSRSMGGRSASRSSSNISGRKLTP